MDNYFSIVGATYVSIDNETRYIDLLMPR